jgi:hypothetical protein
MRKFKSYLKLTKDDLSSLKRTKKGSLFMKTGDIKTAIRIYEKMNKPRCSAYYARQLAEKTRTMVDYKKVFRLLVSDGSCLAAARLAREKNLNYDAKDLYEKAIYARAISGRITDAYQVALEKAAFTGNKEDTKRAKDLDRLAANYYS